MSVVLVSVSIFIIVCLAAVFGGFVDNRVLIKFTNTLARILSVFKVSPLSAAGKDFDKKSGSIEDFASRNTSRGVSKEGTQDLYSPLNMNALNCRVSKVELKEDDSIFDAFAVELCGSINAPHEISRATLNISIRDMSDESQPEPVLENNPLISSQDRRDAQEFKHVAELGRLPHKTTKLENWTAVARFRTDGPVFPRRGRRNLCFKTSVLNAEDDKKLAEARCNFIYDNSMPGYLDMRDNAERTRVLTVALAFAISAIDDSLYDSEIDLIKQWARENVLDSAESNSKQSSAKLEKALNKTVAFFKEGNKLDIVGLCEEIVDISPLALRYEILDLCLRVAKVKGLVTAEEMSMIKSLSDQLEVNPEKFRDMVEKIMPIEIHEVMGVDDILGITSDMSSEKTRRHLNREYSKWNSRVTSADPDIQSKADQMLKLIAEARGRYMATGSVCSANSTQK